MSGNLAEQVHKPLGASNRKPLVISSSRYQKIIATISGENAHKTETDEEQRYKDYLKRGSDNMVAKWSGSFKRTQEEKQAERKQKLADKIRKEKQEFLKIREKDEQIRREKIAKAQELIQKLKPGPKELQSAAIQSETLKGRAVQRNINKEFEETLKKRTAEEQFQMECQAMPWIEEGQRRTSNQMHRNNQYKAELLNAINDKSRKNTEHSQHEMRESRLSRNVSDKEIKAQIAKEQDMLMRKREALRKNALEAMIMVEQRRAREQVQDMMEGKIIEIYNDGKQNIEHIKRVREAQARQDHIARNTANAQHLAALQPDISKEEEERLRKDISTSQLQFTAQEEEKIQICKERKLARIQEYYRELEFKNEQKTRRAEHTRLALANRLKNEEVSAAFEQKRSEDKVKKAQELRKVLADQIEKRKQTEADLKAYDIQCTTVNFEKDDKFFFDYANNLVDDAIKKERPLYPFVKAVQQYRRENGIGVDRKLPPHLESHLRIGVKTPPPPSTENEATNDVAARATILRYGLNELKNMDPYSPRSLASK